MVSNVRPAKGPISVLSLITTVILIVVIAAAVGAFLYQSYLNGRIASDQQSLNLTQGQFDPTTINQIIRLDSRINIAKSLLSSHIQLSNVFALLENATIQTVRFTSFTLTTGDQGVLNLVLGGEALGFSDVASQSAAFNQSTYFKNLVVSDLSVEANGGVTFTMAMDVSPTLVAFAPPTQSAPPIQTPPPVSTTTINSLSATASSTNATKP